MIEPMLASLSDAKLDDPDLVYEPKYDGIRAIADVPVGGHVRLWSRLGNEKTAQFPEIARALERWAAKRREPVVLDGEIVALDGAGRPISFQNLQGRIHLGSLIHRGAPRGRRDIRKPSADVPTAFIAFDLLKEGQKDLRELPLTARREALEKIFSKTGDSTLRLSEQVRGDGRKLYSRALSSGWEGLIAKRADSRYRSGKRTPDWRKLKIVCEQEFVIGGWTEPRESRSYFGSLILGVYEPAETAAPAAMPTRKRGSARREGISDSKRRGWGPGAIEERPLVYVGHVGTGFNERELDKLSRLFRPLETRESPFDDPPAGNEKPHWVKPKLVAQVKFTEWTADGILRHPVYLGLRDDKKASDVVREDGRRFSAATNGRLGSSRRGTSGSSEPEITVVDQLRFLEDNRRDGTLTLPDGDTIAVTNLHKVFWPKLKLTKGDLFRYYAQVAPYLLPAVTDRPMVMKRLPDGITGKTTFYQHRATDVPPGVRVEPVKVANARPQIIGGDLKTLLYMTQLASISQDPWFSRVQSPAMADHAALDLDPMPDVPFARVLDVARWIHDELERLGTMGCAKTSGADGLHIYVPLPPDTPYEAGQIFCQIIATVVATRHPKHATIERAVQARGQRVYIDFLQNIQGKTLATAYSARSSEYAGVSTPLTWKEVDEGVRREDFTMKTVPARLATVGDLWTALRKSKGIDLSRVARYANAK
jgi:bifunctional non-homologous end joining protein LigD